ncbi:molybdopterin-binding protein [Ruminococcaceae bacterium OttesenSCG-928-A11]|nr:molybdopterin-binding protein [Ruminococcaceae bacterium OttesenSCG-928-A11]
MREIRTEDAAGHVLCHDITEIVRGVTKDAAFRKGHVVTEADIPVLLRLGKESLFVWEKQPGMLHENEAADILYAICAGGAAGIRPTPVKEGKIEAVAETDGFLQIDVERLRAVNSLGEMMIATRHTNTPVKAGDHLAGTRVIPLVISEAKMEQARAVAGGAPLLTLRPYKPKKYAIITTGSEVFKGRIKDTFTPVIRDKLAPFGGQELGHIILGDDPAAVTEAIENFIAKGAELVLCTGGMSVDPDDKTPLAIKNTGARIVSYGAPVLPGAMFMLAYTAAGVPIAGLPGCVMYAGRTVFDLVLPRLMADIPVTDDDLAGLGHGGLCLNCPTCIFPNCGFGAGV